jgi:hypothetical protein
MRRLWCLLAACAAAVAAPTCTWMCDDPKCDAVCTPVCQAPACFCIDASQCDIKPLCSVSCNTTYDDGCPSCETQCAPDAACLGRCDIVCPPTLCAWDCIKPTNCPAPVCELQCDQPSCSANISHMNLRTGALNGQSGAGAPAPECIRDPWGQNSVIATVVVLAVVCTVALSAFALQPEKRRRGG